MNIIAVVGVIYLIETVSSCFPEPFHSAFDNGIISVFECTLNLIINSKQIAGFKAAALVIIMVLKYL